MFEEDYILRMVQALAAAIARIAGLNRTEDHAGALAEAERAWEILDVPPALARTVDTATLVGLLREPAKLRLAARLFREEARALRGQGDAARAELRTRRALELLLEARALDPAGRAEDDPLIAELATAVSPAALAGRYRTLLASRR